VFENALDNTRLVPTFDERDDLHLRAAVRTAQRIHFVHPFQRRTPTHSRELDPSGLIVGALVTHRCEPRGWTSRVFWSFVAKQLFCRYYSLEAELGWAARVPETQAVAARPPPKWISAEQYCSVTELNHAWEAFGVTPLPLRNHLLAGAWGT